MGAGLQPRMGRRLVSFHAPRMGGGGRCDWAYIALDCRSVVSLDRANRANGRGNYGVRFRPRPCELRGSGCWDSGMVAADRRDGSLQLVPIALGSHNRFGLGCESRRDGRGVARRRLEPARGAS